MTDIGNEETSFFPGLMRLLAELQVTGLFVGGTLGLRIVHG